MFSTLFAKASAAVPNTQPTRDRLHPMSRRATDLERPLEPDGAPDIGRVLFAERLLDVAANRVQLVPRASMSAWLRCAYAAMSAIAMRFCRYGRVGEGWARARTRNECGRPAGIEI